MKKQEEIAENRTEIMHEEMRTLDSGRLCSEAKRLSVIYEEFTEAVQALGRKSKGRGKMSSSLAHWIGGSHVVTDRERLCEKFLTDVQGQLELLQLALEAAERNTADLETAARVCMIIADILTKPCPANSNATTDLMKRAMIGQVKPFLIYLEQEQLLYIQKRLEQAYGRWKMLPVEKEIYREIKRRISSFSAN